MSETNPESVEYKGGSFLAAVVRFFVRLLFVVVLGIAIGAATYFIGFPALTRQQIQVAETTASRLDDLASDQEITNQQISERLSALQDRIVDLEVFRDSNQESLDGFGEQIENLAADQATKEDTLNLLGDEMAARLDEIQRDFDTMDTALAEIEVKIEEMKDREGTLSTEVAESIAVQDGIIEEIASDANSARELVESLRRELAVLKAMELITRSRLFIAQENFGLAADDVQMARDLLAESRTQIPATEVGPLTEIVDRLDAALVNLPRDPSLAEDDLELAWQLLVRGFGGQDTVPPTQEPEETPEPAPALTPSTTPTATP